MFDPQSRVARLELAVAPSLILPPTAVIHFALHQPAPAAYALVPVHTYIPGGTSPFGSRSPGTGAGLELSGALSKANLAFDLPQGSCPPLALPLMPLALGVESQALLRQYYLEQTKRVFEKMPWRPSQEQTLRCTFYLGDTTLKPWLLRRRIEARVEGE